LPAFGEELARAFGNAPAVNIGRFKLSLQFSKQNGNFDQQTTQTTLAQINQKQY